jgi:hypothetical protein
MKICITNQKLVKKTIEYKYQNNQLSLDDLDECLTKPEYCVYYSSICKDIPENVKKRIFEKTSCIFDYSFFNENADIKECLDAIQSFKPTIARDILISLFLENHNLERFDIEVDFDAESLVYSSYSSFDDALKASENISSNHSDAKWIRIINTKTGRSHAIRTNHQV